MYNKTKLSQLYQTMLKGMDLTEKSRVHVDGWPAMPGLNRHIVSMWLKMVPSVHSDCEENMITLTYV